MSPLNKRRWQNFKQNKRAIYSLLIFSIFFLISVFAEFIANDKPLMIYYNNEFYSPIIKNYSERVFGGEFETEAEYKTIEVECLILSGGMLDECLDNPKKTICYCNGGDRSHEKKIREASICKEHNVDLIFGIGGVHKLESSSSLTKNYFLPYVHMNLCCQIKKDLKNISYNFCEHPRIYSYIMTFDKWLINPSKKT